MIIQQSAFTKDVTACEECRENRDLLRCKDCIGGAALCVRCCREKHQTLWYHRIEKWTGSHFKPGALWQIGVKVYLGHKGQQCPAIPSEPENAVESSNTSAPNTSAPEMAANSMSAEEVVTEPTVEDIEEDAIPGEEPAEDDGDYVDVTEEPHGKYPNILPIPNTSRDNDDNQYLTIVDVSGIHHLPLSPCLCNESQSRCQDEQLLDLGLFPASQKNIRTCFTLAVLKDFRLANLECKTTAYQYYNKLRRLTCPAFPALIPNRHRELRRLSRQYRNLKLWQMHGHGHDQSSLPRLALFCAACPQPGVNLAPDWKEDPDR